MDEGLSRSTWAVINIIKKKASMHQHQLSCCCLFPGKKEKKACLCEQTFTLFFFLKNKHNTNHSGQHVEDTTETCFSYLSQTMQLMHTNRTQNIDRGKKTGVQSRLCLFLFAMWRGERRKHFCSPIRSIHGDKNEWARFSKVCLLEHRRQK